MPLWIIALSAVLLGCGPSREMPGGAGGQEACTWCAPIPPRTRTCSEVMIASGGQRVCVDDGQSRLCEARCPE